MVLRRPPPPPPRGSRGGELNSGDDTEKEVPMPRMESMEDLSCEMCEWDRCDKLVVLVSSDDVGAAGSEALDDRVRAAVL